MKLFNQLNMDIGYVVIVMGIAMFFMFIMLISIMINYNKLNKKYRRFMTGSSGKSLEKEIAKKFKRIGNLSEQVKDLDKNVDEFDEKINDSYQKMGLIKYDAFNEMGGKLSFALCILTAKNNGFIINSMHSKDGCYTYIKEIIKGESFVQLADEEREALSQAIGNDELMI